MMEGEPPGVVLVIWAIIALVFLFFIARHYVQKWFGQSPPAPVECEEEEVPPIPPPPRVPRIFNLGETFSVGVYPLLKTPRDRSGNPIRFQLGDRFVRGPSRTWSLNGHITDISDAEIEALLRVGHVGHVIREGFKYPQENPLLIGTIGADSRTMEAPSRSSPGSWSVVLYRTAALHLGQPRDPYANAPVVKLIKAEPRASRYERILEEEDDAPQVHSEPRDS